MAETWNERAAQEICEAALKYRTYQMPGKIAAIIERHAAERLTELEQALAAALEMQGTSTPCPDEKCGHRLCEWQRRAKEVLTITETTQRNVLQELAKCLRRSAGLVRPRTAFALVMLFRSLAFMALLIGAQGWHDHNAVEWLVGIVFGTFGWSACNWLEHQLTIDEFAESAENKEKA